MELPEPEFGEHQDFVVTFRNGTNASADETTSLNGRQQIALRIIREKGSINTGEYCAATGASERTALRELRDMVDRTILVSRGKTRGLRYFLSQHNKRFADLFRHTIPPNMAGLYGGILTIGRLICKEQVK